MNFRDFLLLFGVCLVWGLNIVLTRWVVADMQVPPLSSPRLVGMT